VQASLAIGITTFEIIYYLHLQGRIPHAVKTQDKSREIMKQQKREINAKKRA
jgi:hypothetical protein